MLGGRNFNAVLETILDKQVSFRPLYLLILLSGVPKESDELYQLLRDTVQSHRAKFSFVQIGDDGALKAWLDNLGAVEELQQGVDVTTLESMRGKWLSEVVETPFDYVY